MSRDDRAYQLARVCARLPRTISTDNAHRLARQQTAGELLARTGTKDVLDALVALVAVPGDQLLTSHPDDLHTLIAARDIPVTVVRV